MEKNFKFQFKNNECKKTRIKKIRVNEDFLERKITYHSQNCFHYYMF